VAECEQNVRAEKKRDHVTVKSEEKIIGENVRTRECENVDVVSVSFGTYGWCGWCGGGLCGEDKREDNNRMKK